MSSIDHEHHERVLPINVIIHLNTGINMLTLFLNYHYLDYHFASAKFSNAYMPRMKPRPVCVVCAELFDQEVKQGRHSTWFLEPTK